MGTLSSKEKLTKVNIEGIVQRPEPVAGSNRVVETLVPELLEHLGDDDLLEGDFDVLLGDGLLALNNNFLDYVLATLLGCSQRV